MLPVIMVTWAVMAPSADTSSSEKKQLREELQDDGCKPTLKLLDFRAWYNVRFSKDGRKDPPSVCESTELTHHGVSQHLASAPQGLTPERPTSRARTPGKWGKSHGPTWWRVCPVCPGSAEVLRDVKGFQPRGPSSEVPVCPSFAFHSRDWNLHQQRRQNTAVTGASRCTDSHGQPSLEATARHSTSWHGFRPREERTHEQVCRSVLPPRLPPLFIHPTPGSGLCHLRYRMPPTYFSWGRVHSGRGGRGRGEDAHRKRERRGCTPL